jgi:hypothetical protein
MKFFIMVTLFLSIIITGFASADVEPNNSTSSAESASEGTLYSGHVSMDPKDVDYYSFNFKSEKLVKFELYFDSGPDDGMIILTNVHFYGGKGSKINISVNGNTLFSTKTVDTGDFGLDFAYILIEGEGFYRFKTLYGERAPGSDGSCGMVIGSGLLLSLVILFIPVFSSRNKNIRE